MKQMNLICRPIQRGEFPFAQRKHCKKFKIAKFSEKKYCKNSYDKFFFMVENIILPQSLSFKIKQQGTWAITSAFFKRLDCIQNSKVLAFWRFVSNSCFPVDFAKFLRTPFFIEHISWLLYMQNV